MTKAIDKELLLDLITSGMSRKDIAETMGVSPPTISNKIEELKRDESALLAYDKVHYLDLINVKQRLIANMTDDKMGEAPLGQLAQAYGTIGKMEQLIQGRPTEIRGLMGYLIHLEQEDIANSSSIIDIDGNGDAKEDTSAG
jgi:DNA-binding XRE family transcriptional regulator